MSDVVFLSPTVEPRPRAEGGFASLLILPNDTTCSRICQAEIYIFFFLEGTFFQDRRETSRPPGHQPCRRCCRPFCAGEGSRAQCVRGAGEVRREEEEEGEEEARAEGKTWRERGKQAHMSSGPRSCPASIPPAASMPRKSPGETGALNSAFHVRMPN